MTTTAKDWRTLPAGRELDALVAERVAGWRWVRTWRGERFLAPPTFVPDPLYHRDWMDGTETDEESRWWLRDTKPGADLDVVPHLSTDVAVAWPVVEKLRGQGYFVTVDADLSGDEPWRCEFDPIHSGRVAKERANTPALAIARAALAATEAR